MAYLFQHISVVGTRVCQLSLELSQTHIQIAGNDRLPGCSGGQVINNIFSGLGHNVILFKLIEIIDNNLIIDPGQLGVC